MGGSEGWGPEGWGFEGWGFEGWGGPTQKKWGPEGYGPEGGARRVGAQNFALFSLSRRKIRSFLPSLGVFSWNFGGVLKRWGAQMCTFGVLGLSCASPGGPVPTLAKPTLAKVKVLVVCKDFGFSELIVQFFFVCFELTWGGSKGGGSKGGGPNPEKVGPQGREREKKERNFGRSMGRAVQGRAVPGRAVPGALNMTKPKPSNPHMETVKPTPTPHKHTQTHTNTHTHTQTHTNTHKHKSKSVWPKSAMTKSIPMPQAMKIPAVGEKFGVEPEAVDKEWEKLEKIPA